MRKAWFYIKRLKEKGLTDEDIIKKTHFHKGRYEFLKRIGTIPTKKEIRKLRSMLILSSEESRKSALKIWDNARSKEKPEEKPVKIEKPRVFTKNQIDVLKTLLKKETVLPRTKAVVASSLRKNGLVETYLNENDKRVYKLTESGVVVASGITSSVS